MAHWYWLDSKVPCRYHSKDVIPMLGLPVLLRSDIHRYCSQPGEPPFGIGQRSFPMDEGRIDQPLGAA